MPLRPSLRASDRRTRLIKSKTSKEADRAQDLRLDRESLSFVEQLAEGSTMIALIMSLTEVRRRIDNSDFEIIVEARLPNNLGTKIVTAQGHVVVVYDLGKAVIQGKNPEQMGKVLTTKRYMRI